MSVEASVDELYGDSKDDKWKNEEVARLKAEQGITEIEEPDVNMRRNEFLVRQIIWSNLWSLTQNMILKKRLGLLRMS